MLPTKDYLKIKNLLFKILNIDLHNFLSVSLGTAYITYIRINREAKWCIESEQKST